MVGEGEGVCPKNGGKDKRICLKNYGWGRGDMLFKDFCILNIWSRRTEHSWAKRHRPYGKSLYNRMSHLRKLYIGTEKKIKRERTNCRVSIKDNVNCAKLRRTEEERSCGKGDIQQFKQERYSLPK